MPKKKAKKATTVAKKATMTKDREIADLKRRLATAEKKNADLEAKLKKIQSVIDKWDGKPKSENNYPGSAYDLTRPRRPWGGRPGGIRYGIPF